MDQVMLFRLSAAFCVLGLSLISFLVAGLLKERSAAQFSALHSFSAGLMLGTAFLFADPDGLADISAEMFMNAVYISLLGFVLMVGVEYFTTASLYDYEPLGDVVDHVEMVAHAHKGLITDTEDPEECSPDHPEFSPDFMDMKAPPGVESIALRSFKFYPFILLISASTSDMLSGLHFTTREHSGAAVLLVMAAHKALMACAFGTMLEASTAPRSIVLYFMFTYSFSSPVGIVLGAVLSETVSVSSGSAAALKYTDLIVTALTAGVYLYTATMRLIPNALLRGEPNLAGGGFIQTKAAKFACFLAGCALTIIPTVMISNT
ncbi:Zinc/iron permease [Ochromonadaceae sp. CCMP2298]|nr:Zinc/iron permease [Ochromonadaceae sp. CCMP2298]